MTAPNDAYQHRSREFLRLSQAYETAVKEEFKPGMRVEWTHSYTGALHDKPVKRQGVVTGSSYYGGRVNIVMREGGPTHRIDSYLLEIIK